MFSVKLEKIVKKNNLLYGHLLVFSNDVEMQQYTLLGFGMKTCVFLLCYLFNPLFFLDPFVHWQLYRSVLLEMFLLR